jgi:uncharacterized protein (TIGR02246 family)
MPATRPEDCDQLFEEYVNAGDLDGVVTLYEPAATFVTQEGTSVSGIDAIRNILGGFIAMKPQLKNRVVKVVRTGDDVAMIFNDWTLLATDPDGKPISIMGRAIELLRRQADGTWRMIIDAPWGRR